MGFYCVGSFYFATYKQATPTTIATVAFDHRHKRRNCSRHSRMTYTIFCAFLKIIWEYYGRFPRQRIDSSTARVLDLH